MNLIKYVSVGAGLVAFASFNMFLKAKTVVYKVRSQKVNGKIRVAFLSDIHSCYYGKNQIELIKLVDAQKPDVVLFGGDIVDEILPQKNAFTVFENLADKYPCYYVTGNHEHRSGKAQRFKNTINNLGVTVLEGDCRKINIGNSTIGICGCDDFDFGDDVVLSQLDNIKALMDDNIYNILISHRPEHIGTYIEYNFDLILSGHAHGGQWRVPGLINGVYAPGQGLFPKFAGGRYRLNDSDFIVSRGLAREKKLIPRIFNNPELVIVDIDKK